MGKPYSIIFNFAWNWAEELSKLEPRFASDLQSVIENPMNLKHIKESDARKLFVLRLIAVLKDGSALQFIEVLTPSIINAAIMEDGMALQYVPEQMKIIPIVLDAVYKDGRALQFVPDEIKRNYGVVSCAVKQNGIALEYAPDAYKDNKEICAIAVKQNGRALKYVSARLKNNLEICSLAVHQNEAAIEFMGSNILTRRLNNGTICLFEC